MHTGLPCFRRLVTMLRQLDLEDIDNLTLTYLLNARMQVSRETMVDALGAAHTSDCYTVMMRRVFLAEHSEAELLMRGLFQLVDVSGPTTEVWSSQHSCVKLKLSHCPTIATNTSYIAAPIYYIIILFDTVVRQTRHFRNEKFIFPQCRHLATLASVTKACRCQTRIGSRTREKTSFRRIALLNLHSLETISAFGCIDTLFEIKLV